MSIVDAFPIYQLNTSDMTKQQSTNIVKVDVRPTLRPPLTLAPNVKVMINVGALLDIPTGRFVRGHMGQYILNGGMGTLTGVVGIGNNFKSTFMNYINATFVARMGGQTSTDVYDTEINIHEWHLTRQHRHHPDLAMTDNFDLIGTGRWNITDKTVYTGDEWFDLVKDFMELKIKDKAKYSVVLPFLDRAGKPMVIPAPTSLAVDSMSEFNTKDVLKMQEENSLGDSGANMVSMKQGAQKNRLLMELPPLAAASYTYTFMTAHIGTEFNMDPRNPPPKKLQFLKGGQKLKGVPEKFTFMMNNCYQCYNAAPFINQLSKAPEYPRSPDDDMKMDTDLSVVSVRQLRSKSGPSGMATELIVSQQEGVLPGLTEFHYIKGNGRWGLGGNDRNYFLEFLPDVALSRTTVRAKIKKDYKLRRGMNLAAEMHQMFTLWHDLPPQYVVTPEQLYKKLNEMGYDWDVLLETRGWWAPLGEWTEIQELSSLDFLRMYTGEYIPYWFTEEQKAKIDLSKAGPAPTEESEYIGHTL